MVVLSVVAMSWLHLEHLWVAFGTGHYFRYIFSYEIAASNGPEGAIALPMFHAHTGCDIVSSFVTRGKKLTSETWNAFDDVTATFRVLGDAPGEIDDEAIAMLDRFTVLLYDRIVDVDNIDGVRQHLVTKLLSAYKVIGISTTNKSCTSAACQEGSLSRWPHLGESL